MFPEHCKEVSVKKVEFPLTDEEIRKNILGKLAYRRTKYLVLNNGDKWAVVRIKKPLTKELFSSIEEIEIISLPPTTKYLEERSIDVLSPTMMADKAKELGTETLIIKGKFEHVSFIHNEKPVPILVFEVVPPEPPKLVELAKKALYSGNIDKPVKMMPQVLDLNTIAEECKSQNIIFPCHASGLISDKRTFYLDQRPELTEEDLKDVYLIGCDLSLRIFKTLHNAEPKFFNFCLKKRIMDDLPEYAAITKCCKIKEGHERIGNIAIVPWGATLKEVEDALNDLLASANAHDTQDE